MKPSDYLGFNYNKMYDNPAERAAAAKSALRATAFGRGGIISIVEEQGKIKFQIPLLNKVFETLTEAVNEAAGLGVSETYSFEVGKPLYRVGSKVNAPASIFESINNRLMHLSDHEKALLKNSGIDINDLGQLRMEVSTIRAGKGGTQEVVKKLEQLRERQQMMGITVMDDEGARVIQFSANKKSLSAHQAHLLLSVTGHDVLDPVGFAKALGSGNPGKLAKLLGKNPKRQRRLLAERDISLAGEELEKLLTRRLKGGKTAFQTLQDATLILDPQYEILKMFASDTGSLDDVEDISISKGAKAFYRDQTANKYIGNVIDAAKVDPKIGEKAIEKLKISINSFGGGKGKEAWTSEALRNHLKTNFAGKNVARQNLIENLFSTIEKGFDGADLINTRFLARYRKSLVGEISSLKNDIPNISGAARDEARLRISEIEALLKNLQDIHGMQQVTGSGNIAGFGNIKTAFYASDFVTSGLRQYSAIISKFGFKTESGLAGRTDQLILSGLGKGSDRVYADPVLAAFHSQLVSGPKSVEAMLNRGRMLTAEFNAAIESDILPEKVIRQLEKAAAIDPSTFASELQQSAIRNRQFAQDLLEMHRTGVSVKNSPRMMNMLSSFYATQAFREKDGFVQPVLPNTYRFGIASDTVLSPGRDPKNVLGTGFERIGPIRFKDAAGTSKSLNIDHDIMKFRLIGHQMLVAPQAVSEFYQSLGGFDLDDKGLPMMRKYTDQDGLNRLGFYIFRQPSGRDEKIFARATMDSQTVKALFDNTYFTETLSSMLKMNPRNSDLKILSNILESKDIISVQQADQDRLEQAIVEVYRELEDRKITSLAELNEKEIKMIEKYGSSAMRIDPKALGGVDLGGVNPRYTGSKAYKLLTEAGVFDMSQEIASVVDESALDSATKAKIKALAARNKADDFEKIMGVLEKGFEKNPAARAVLSHAFDIVAQKSAKQQGGSLGLYINRSMVAGSVLDQYEDFYNSLNDTRDVKIKSFLRDNYNIGLLPSEEAIDLNINFDGGRQLNEALIREVNKGSLINETKLAEEVSRITGLGKSKQVTLDVLGKESMANLGKLIGFSRSIETEESLRLGIDQFLLSNRVKGDDMMRLAENILEGMIDAKKMNRNLRANLDEDIANLQKLVNKPNENDIRSYVEQMIGLGPESKYAGLGKLNEIGNLLKSYSESAKKMGLAGMQRDESLLSAKTTEEARRVAVKIISDNEGSFKMLEEMQRADFKEMSEGQIVRRRELMDKLGRDVYGQIDQAVKLKNVSYQSLINALDIETAGTYRDIGALRALIGEGVDEKYEKVQQNIFDVRRLTRLDRFTNFDPTVADEAISILKQYAKPDEKLTMDNLRRQANRAIEDMIDSDRGTLKEAILQTLVGNRQAMFEDGADEAAQAQARMLAQEAQKQANIINAIASRAELGGERIADLVTEGQIEEIAPGTDEGLERLIRVANGSEDAAANRPAVYKRLSEKVNDFKNLYKNDKLIRRGTLAIAALAIGSIAYTEVKERTADSITGPPLLPGGNPYESEYPSLSSQIPSLSNGGYSPGMSYQVSINGSREQVDQFNASASGLVNGNLSTTMYNRIPDVRRDPYQEMGQRF